MTLRDHVQGILVGAGITQIDNDKLDYVTSFVEAELGLPLWEHNVKAWDAVFESGLAPFLYWLHVKSER